MKLLKKTTLVFQENRSDKVYQVELCELASRNEERYLLNFSYGRRGSTLRQGSKTPDPVSLSTAETLFASVVVSKMNKGYVDADDKAPVIVKVSETNEAKAANQILLAALLDSLASESKSKRRSRIIWRLAELAYFAEDAESLAPILVKLIGKGHWLEDYSIVWALGRLQAVVYLDKVQALCHSKYDTLANMAFDVCLQLSTHQQALCLLEKRLLELPGELQQAIQQDHYSDIDRSLSILLSDKNKKQPDFNALLVSCYQLSHLYPNLRKALLVLLETLPFEPGYFKGVRAIYKIAELRLDGPVFALLARRFETTKAYFRNEYNWTWIEGEGSIKVDKELKKPNSKLAYSNRTRDYLRRRTWRSIQRLGSCGDRRYVEQATEVLLAIRDEHGDEPRRSEQFNYVNQDGRWQSQLASSRYFDSFASFLSFNHILFEHSEVYKALPNGRSWQKNEQAVDVERSECFPELWEQQPEYALRLLERSECALVHDFAGGLLRACPEFCLSINVIQLATLLGSAYVQTNELALDLVKQRLANECLDNALLLALLQSSLEQARVLGLEHMQQSEIESDDIDWLCSLLSLTHHDVQTYVLAALQNKVFSAEQQKLLLNALVNKLLCINGELEQQHINRLAAFILQHAATATSQYGLTNIESLLMSSDCVKQLLGAHLLVGNAIAFGDIPERLLQAIHHSDSAAVRGMGGALIGKQDDDKLILQLGLLVGLYQKGEQAERAELLVLFQRLVLKKSDWAEQILQCLMTLAFQSEQQQGLHDEVVEFFAAHLQTAMLTLDKNTVWRLLQAQSRAAQRLGALALPLQSASLFSVKQWALMGRHVDVSVRQFAYSAYRDNVGMIKQNVRDALPILDNAWQDASEFGFDFFRQHFDKQEWTPQTIIFLCDSVNEAVQAFGRELLQGFFEQEDGPEYLLKLSQHPSNNMQLFVSNFLQDYATDQPERILSLQAYFTTVLSQVNKGRLCKDRIFSFLLQEALKDKAVAEMVAALFARLSLTVVHKDKARLIQAMLQLQALDLIITLPLKTKSTLVKSTST